MLEVLEFVFSSPWRFLGVLFLISAFNPIIIHWKGKDNGE